MKWTEKLGKRVKAEANYASNLIWFSYLSAWCNTVYYKGNSKEYNAIPLDKELSDEERNLVVKELQEKVRGIDSGFKVDWSLIREDKVKTKREVQTEIFRMAGNKRPNFDTFFVFANLIIISQHAVDAVGGSSSVLNSILWSSLFVYLNRNETKASYYKSVADMSDAKDWCDRLKKNDNDKSNGDNNVNISGGLGV